MGFLFVRGRADKNRLETNDPAASPTHRCLAVTACDQTRPTTDHTERRPIRNLVPAFETESEDITYGRCRPLRLLGYFTSQL